MELTNWRQLCDRGPELVPCLDFPGARAAASFADLADGVRIDACFLHIGQAGAGPLAECVDRWADELLATGRPLRAVLGYCAGSVLATRLAEVIAAKGPPPVVVLFDAVATTGGSLAGQFTSVLEASAKHLTADELADAHALAEQLVAEYPDDLPRIAAALIDRYDRLMRAVAGRLSLNEVLRQELTGAFAAYLEYLLLTSEGGFEVSVTDPLFLCSAGYEPPLDGARTIAFDTSHDEMLRDPAVHKIVAELLTGEHPW
jgi:hypothetical protein